MNFFGQIIHLNHVPRWLWPFVRLQMLWIVSGLIRSDQEAWLRGCPFLVFEFSRWGRVSIRHYMPVDAPERSKAWRLRPRVISGDLCRDTAAAWAKLAGPFNAAPLDLWAVGTFYPGCSPIIACADLLEGRSRAPP